MTSFPGKGKVAVIKTTPNTILADIEQVMRQAGVEQALPKDVTTGLKINISWQTWYPACSPRRGSWKAYHLRTARDGLQRPGWNSQ
jgi:hypothetical protein